MQNSLLCIALFVTVPGTLLCAEPAEAKTDGRPPRDDADRQYWLANLAYHHFTDEEIALALGISKTDASTSIERFRTNPEAIQKSIPIPTSPAIAVLPYPGGRHPRIGFLDGAVHPHRETKVSIFAPWTNGGYIVIDLPEAVWHQPNGKRELLFLAHTHVPTIWDKQNVKLPALEWNRDEPNHLSLTRTFPNKVSMTSRVKSIENGIRLQFSITNESKERLTGLHIQMCGMLKALTGFDAQTNDNKIFSPPFATCRDQTGKRWVIFGFDHIKRAWGNPPCPCLHADPQVPDCAPGETQTVHGWVSFFEGEDVADELKRLETIAFQPITTR